MNHQPVKQGLRSALDIYLFAMRPFMVRYLHRVRGGRIEDTIRRSLNGGKRYDFDRDLSDGKSMEDAIGVGHLLFLTKNNWNEVFYSAFGGDRDVQGLMANVCCLRNRLAHPTQQEINEDFDPYDAQKCLGEIANMMGRINRPNEKSWVESLSERLLTPFVATGISVPAVPEKDTPEASSLSAVESLATYWVYEDGPTNRARIHKAACRFCNDGRGLHISRLPDNRWIGPLESAEVALEVALDTERKDIAECKFCRPLQ